MITNEDAQIIESFAEYRRSAGDADSTVRNALSIIRNAGRNVPSSLVEASVMDLRRFIGRDGVTPGTRRTERGRLLSFFTFLVEDGWREDNPAEKLPKVRVPKGEPRPFVQEDIDRMLASGAYFRTRAMIILGYYQGFRVSQIAAVRAEDIDLIGGTIHTVGKGGKNSHFPLHPMVADLAKRMPKSGYWFPARADEGGHITGHAVTCLVTRAKKRAGITDPKLTPHSLRHGFGTGLVENGVDIRVIAELMGHADIGTTQIYTRVSPAMRRAGIGALPSTSVPASSGRARRQGIGK